MDSGIMASNLIAKAHQGEDVLEQTANPGVMHPFGRGGFAESSGDFLVLQECLEQHLEVRIPEPGDPSLQFGPHLSDIALGLGNEIAEHVFAGSRAAKLIDVYLKLLVVPANLTADFDDVARLKISRVGCVPDTRFDGASAVRESQREVARAVFFGAN